MSSNVTICNSHDYSPIEMHQIAKRTGKPHFLQACLSVTSQLDVDKWLSLLKDNWDQLLLQLLQFGFPLHFNRCSLLQHEVGTDSSANEFPADVGTYKLGTLLGPFQVNPIENSHNSPFMTRNKPNSDRRRVIIDLSWPLGASVNSCIDKNTYLDAPFTFPTVHEITSELKRLGRGTLQYKSCVPSRQGDPSNYDQIGFHQCHVYSICVFHSGYSTEARFFNIKVTQCITLMRQKGFCVIDYIDDYVEFGMPSVAPALFVSLFDLMKDLGVTIKKKKLIPPSTKLFCLGIIFDTEKGTVSIPPEKLCQGMAY